MSAMVFMNRLSALERAVADLQQQLADTRKSLEIYTAPKTLTLPKKNVCPIPTAS